MERCLRTFLLSLVLVTCGAFWTGCDDSSSNSKDTNGGDTAADATTEDVTVDVTPEDLTSNDGTEDVNVDVEIDQVACTDDCTEANALQCDGQAVLQCTDDNNDGCLEWITLLTCGAGTVCTGGTCEVPVCTNQTCTTPGAKQCGTANDVETCADLNSDGCLEWSPGVACTGGLTCSNGLCVTQCTDACTAIGTKDCDGNGDVVTCSDTNSDGCLEWGNPLPCATDLVCSLGSCASSCSSGCTVLGARQCNASGAVVECGDYNSDGCLEWGSAVPCSSPLVCSGGNCAATCSDGCTFVNERQCVAGNTNQFQVCDDYNSDGCLEWGTPDTCATSLVCSGAGTCASTCSDSCPTVNDVRCSTNAVQTCGDYNADGCIEWGTPATCEAYEVCAGGVCTQDTPQEIVIISEFLYDSTGSPDTESFVELYGPVGTNLAGYSLVGVNGNGGADYVAIPLTGVIDSTKLFVIAHPNATGTTAAQADLTNAGVDLQNSPDSLQLRYGTLVVDAVAYGTFGTGTPPTVSAGEGTPAPDGVVGESLSRDASFTDTDDNFADFKLKASPTPGTATTANGAPNAVLSCPGSGTTTQSLSFDASSSTDDGSIVLYAFNFGDGSPISSGSATATSHTFATVNTFTVTLTVTDNGGLTDQATCQVVISAPNNPPVAALSCPASGTVGQQLTVSGAGSTDDGTIVTYRFDFGDATTPVSGPATSANHTYTAAANYTVSLTVTDNSGLTNTKTCLIPVADGSGPTVNFIKPINNKQVTQGETVQILVDVTPAPGRNVTQVEFFVDGSSIGTDTGAPYEINYAVPLSAATSSLIPVVAQATDNLGGIGISETRNLFVWNDAPHASFVALVTGALEITVDASSVSDTETATSALEVRWDFDNDGTWDTGWSTTKVTTHTYGGAGTYTVALEVRDTTSQTDTITHDVTLSLIQNVSGTVTTTTWAGTIVITGDVTVPAGNTLTISEGTTVQLVATDQNADGVGDYDLNILGTLLVNGTSTNPVIFTTYGSGNKTPKAWNKLRLAGTGNVINWAIVEYGDVGLEIAGTATIGNTEARMNRVGVSLLTGSNTTWNDGSVHDNVEQGLKESAGTFTGNGLEVRDNGASGIYVTGGTMNVTNGLVQGNGHCGFEYIGSGSGLVTRTLITTNDYEGICIASANFTDPTPVFNTNNIYGNAVVGARVLGTPNLTVTSSGTSTADASSGEWHTPAGEIVDFVFSTYTEYEAYGTSYCSGAVQDWALGTNLYSTISARAAWAWTSAGATGSIRAFVVDDQYDSYGSMNISLAAYNELGATREATVLTGSAKVDLKHNYWGVFPNVLNVLTLGEHTDADIQGFMGVPYDSSWQKGPYVGGESLSGTVNWSGTVFVTGDLTIPVGTTLNVAQGTQVEFAPVDQNVDLIGDYSIEVAGSLVVSGASLNPVKFTTYGTLKAPNDWHRVQVNGASASSNIQYAVFEYGNEGLVLRPGTHVVSNTTVSQMGTAGIQLLSATSVSLTNITTQNNLDDGLWINSSSGVTINRLTSSGNGGDGLAAQSSTSLLSLTNATITNNTGDGMFLTSSHLSVTQSTISGNRFGVRYQSGSQGTLASSNVKFNDREGIALMSSNATSPNPIVTGNNVFGNSVVESGVLVNPGLSATSSGTSTADVTSVPWSTPGAKTIEYVQYAYSEYEAYGTSYCSGFLRQDNSTGTQLVSTVGVQSRYQEVAIPSVTAIVAQVVDDQYDSYGSMSLINVLYYNLATNKELVALNDSGTINCTGNYWGTFPDVQVRMTLTRTNSIDYQGFQIAEITGTGPQ